MRIALFCLLYVSAMLGQSPTPQEKLRAAQTEAPAEYPTAYLVKDASVSASTTGFRINGGECNMTLATETQTYYVSAPAPIKKCKEFEAGTVVFGRMHRILGTVVDIYDPEKKRSWRYVVRHVQAP